MTTLWPYLSVKGGLAAIDFYKVAFGAEEVGQRYQDGDRIGHADLAIAGARFSLSDESPDHRALSPQTLGGAGVHMILNVPEPDALFDRAIGAGCKVDRPMRDEPHGRMGVIDDPFGHRWFICAEA
jgi:uncharacterized glyoxalase superfamily protein PhnB